MRGLVRGLGILLVVLLAALSLVYVALLPPPPLAQPEQGFILESVVLAVPGEPDSEPVDLVMSGDRIAEVRPAAPGPVHGFVQPGLADAHMHGPPLGFPREEELRHS